MCRLMKQTIVLILTIFVIASCLPNKEDVPIITFEELDKLRCEWQEPKISQWFYIGSENGYHWFIHRDLPEDKFYRVSISEYKIENPIIIMNDQSKWVLMPWGPGSDICDKKLST